jgi:hypothetical protein
MHMFVLRVAEQPSPKGKLQWATCLPNLSETTLEVRKVWAYPLEVASPSKPRNKYK